MRNHLGDVVTASVPPGWRIAPLSSVIAEVNGGFSVNCEDRAAQSSEIGVLKTGAVAHGVFDPSQNKYVGPKEHKRLRTSVSAGTIIFCRKNSEEMVGACAQVQQDQPNLFLSDLLWEIRPNGDVSLHWLEALMKSHIVAGVVRLRATGTQSSMKNISQDRLLSISVPVPPPSVQNKIAEILRTWDEAIEACERLIAKLTARQLALVHQLVFGERRLGNYARSSETHKNRWLTVPTDWPVVTIGSVAEERSEVNRNGDAAEVLSCSKYDGFVRSLEYFKKQVFSSDLSGYKLIRRGDFGFPSNHVEEGSIGLQNLVDEGLVSPIYTVFRFDAERVDNDYAYSVLKTELYRHIFQVSTSASVDRRGSLRWSDFSMLPFPLPSIDEQRAIQKVLSAGQSQIDRQKTERDALSKQKRGLMQKILTGEWRVKADA